MTKKLTEADRKEILANRICGIPIEVLAKRVADSWEREYYQKDVSATKHQTEIKPETKKK